MLSDFSEIFTKDSRAERKATFVDSDVRLAKASFCQDL